jgi:putative protease
MKDNNQSANLRALVDAGVRSFKIEGRYKDMGYVKNITAYRQRLDDILEDRPDLARASSGRTAFLPARPGQDLPPRQHRLLRQRPQDRHRRLRLADLHRPAGGRGGKGRQARPAGGHPRAAVQRRRPQCAGQARSGGFRANIAEPKGEFEEDGQKRYRYRVEPNEMPEGLHQLRPNHPLSRNLDHNWPRRCKTSPSAGSAWRGSRAA